MWSVNADKATKFLLHFSVIVISQITLWNKSFSDKSQITNQVNKNVIKIVLRIKYLQTKLFFGHGLLKI